MSELQGAGKIWAIVPAAGLGKRMGSDKPKQYLVLQGKTVLEHSIERLLNVPEIAGVIVALHESDNYWPSIAISNHPEVKVVRGGEERMHSVINALEFLKTINPDPRQFVLIHDAVRPCVRVADIRKLIHTLHKDEVGGLLAAPLVDTLKRSDAQGRVAETINRQHCWRALTPQMFRIGLLEKSFEILLNRKQIASDEAAALEVSGFRPKIVEGNSDNIKLTLPGDLVLMDFILTAQLTHNPSLQAQA